MAYKSHHARGFLFSQKKHNQKDKCSRFTCLFFSYVSKHLARLEESQSDLED